MKLFALSAVLLACAVVSPARAAVTAVSYAPPAGSLPTGHYHGLPYDAVLPSGRLVTPAGTSVVTGVGTSGFALTPDGRDAIVGSITANGSSLAVIDTASMSVVSRFSAPAGDAYAGDIVATADPLQPQRVLVLVAGGGSNAVDVFTLDATGQLVPDRRHVVSIPGPVDPTFADAGLSGPMGVTLSPDGRRAYAVDMLGDSVCAIDLATRTVIGAPRTVGFFPRAAALAGDRLVVTNAGMMRYARLTAPGPQPAFGTPPAALDRASSLSLVDFAAGGALAPAPPETGAPTSLPMDPPADGLRIVSGAQPTAVVTSADGRYAYVTMSNVDRIATVALAPPVHVVGGTELRLFDRGPYGTQPCAMARSRDGSRLYVALHGLDAVAVIDARDPSHLHRLGLIPTGWAPSALALAPDDHTLYVANTNGFGYDGGVVPSTLQKIDLAHVVLTDATRATLGATRTVVATIPHYPHAVKNIVVIAAAHLSFDAVFGDLSVPAASRAFVRYPATVTPNLHALAERYALAENFYAESPDAALDQQIIVGGMATAFAATMRTAGLPLLTVDDPEAAPRIGTIFTELARHNAPFRDYGGFLRVSGAGAAGFGDDVPVAAALAGHVDLAYPTADAAVPDTQRAAAFAADYDAQIAAEATPRVAYVTLPTTDVGATDAALGAIVDHLSHASTWRTTAVIVVSSDTQGSADHVDPSRAFALVISPYAKRGYVGRHHVSTASVLKTIDGLIGLPPLSLGDLLAADLSDFFTTVPDLRAYVASSPTP